MKRLKEKEQGAKVGPQTTSITVSRSVWERVKRKLKARRQKGERVLSFSAHVEELLRRDLEGTPERLKRRVERGGW
jgi:hypothetical protein